MFCFMILQSIILFSCSLAVIATEDNFILQKAKEHSILVIKKKTSISVKNKGISILDRFRSNIEQTSTIDETRINPTVDIIENKHTFNSYVNTRVFENGKIDHLSNNGMYSKCGFSSNERFQTWFIGPQLATDSPVLFPKDDQDLRTVVKTATEHGCKVRVRGAGHSHDGLIMQKEDSLEFDVIVVSLRDYIPNDPDWDENLNPYKPSVKISAGASTFKLASVIRPKGFLTPSFTAAAIFSVGGAYLNPSVHGSIFDGSRYASQVLSLRVMNATGHINVYKDEENVRAFRGSLGLLGIVTAIEIRLRFDTGIKMTREHLKIMKGETHVEEEARKFMKHQLETKDGTEWTYYVYDDIINAYSVEWSGNPGYDYKATKKWYDEQLEKEEIKNVAYLGGGDIADNALSFLYGDGSKVSLQAALAVSKLSRVSSNSGFDKLAQVPNDGYAIRIGDITNLRLFVYSVKCESDCLDEMTILFVRTRELFLHQISDRKSDWFPSLPTEWRRFTVEPNEMVLDNLEPGRWLAMQSFDIQRGNNGGSYQIHRALEELWQSVYPNGRIHIGKEYGFANINGIGDSNDLFPFQNQQAVDDVFPSDVRTKFIEQMKKFDPHGTFRAGAGVRLLGLTNKKYTPKEFNFDSCSIYGDANCFSGCCRSTDMVCVPSNKKKGETCDESCECEVNTSGNACRIAQLGSPRMCLD